jgi:hypothetical protein
MELSSIRRCFITYRECNANNTPYSHDAQRGMQTHACIPPHIFPAKPPPYFFT